MRRGDLFCSVDASESTSEHTTQTRRPAQGVHNGTSADVSDMVSLIAATRQRSAPSRVWFRDPAAPSGTSVTPMVGLAINALIGDASSLSRPRIIATYSRCDWPA